MTFITQTYREAKRGRLICSWIYLSKREEFGDAIYCIDEPEAHIAIAIQGKLLDALLSLLPEDAQLWIATHSIGFVRAAYQRAIERDDVVFLDFSYDDFDQGGDFDSCVNRSSILAKHL